MTATTTGLSPLGERVVFCLGRRPGEEEVEASSAPAPDARHANLRLTPGEGAVWLRQVSAYRGFGPPGRFAPVGRGVRVARIKARLLALCYS